MIKIYKNTMDEEVRLQALELIHSAPDYVWTQSVCTDESVIQLNMVTLGGENGLNS